MQKSHLWALTIFFVCSLSYGQFQPEKINTLKGSTISSEEITNYLQKQIEDQNIPGLSIAIINNSEIAYHDVFGVTNAETQEPVDQKTIFEAASLSKPVFAYFAMKMVEKGLLNLDEPLYQYFPHPAIDSSYTDEYKKITARMVLSHSTGFPNWSHGEKIKLQFEPGTGFSYSGEAYQYLAAIIGQLNGVGWKDDLNQVFLKAVAEPIGLEHTSFTWNNYFEQHKAFGHQDGKTTDNESQGKSFGAGYSLHSEASEYARFLIEIMESKHLSKDLQQQMLTEANHFDQSNELYQNLGQTGWTLGFAQKPSENGMMYLHTGNNHDFQAYCMIIPEKKYGIVLFINTDKMEGLLESLTPILGKQF